MRGGGGATGTGGACAAQLLSLSAFEGGARFTGAGIWTARAPPSGREPVADDFDGFTFGDLEEAGGLARGGAMHVQHVEGVALPWEASWRRRRRGAEVVHLLGGKQEVGVGPAFDPMSGANVDEAAAEFEDVSYRHVSRRRR